MIIQQDSCHDLDLVKGDVTAAEGLRTMLALATRGALLSSVILITGILDSVMGILDSVGLPAGVCVILLAGACVVFPAGVCVGLIALMSSCTLSCRSVMCLVSSAADCVMSSVRLRLIFSRILLALLVAPHDSSSVRLVVRCFFRAMIGVTLVAGDTLTCRALLERVRGLWWPESEPMEVRLDARRCFLHHASSPASGDVGFFRLTEIQGERSVITQSNAHEYTNKCEVSI